MITFPKKGSVIVAFLLVRNSFAISDKQKNMHDLKKEKKKK